uniref:Succinate-semialdehyde dehydrogenase, mitochondrial n=1 Tax=Heliothis virescens TaxID=7102 RepID=A0A2A4J5B5_HELVI
MDFLRAGVRRNTFARIQYRQLHLLKTKAYVEGKWISAGSGNVFKVENPADDSVIAKVPDMGAADAKKAIDAAAEAFKSWQNTTAKERSKILRCWYEIVEANTKDLAAIITAESGKPLAEAKGEIVYGNSFLEWFADCARHIKGEAALSPWPNKHIMVTRQPVGVVSVITPWNFPFAMISRKVGALLAAGCTCVVKPSEDTPLTALAAIQLAEEAGVPKGVINVITSSGKNVPEVGKILCEDPHVRMISFTGSTAVGKLLSGHAAKGIKRLALELGGNAPFIVFPSADIGRSIEHAIIAKFRNNGQACVGANRFLIHENVYDEFICGFKERIKSYCKLGPGTHEGVTCGPLINMSQAKKVSGLVDDAVKKGARTLLGGRFATDIGNKFFECTLMDNITPEMNLYHEEVFGPIASIIKIKCEEEALEIANSTQHGLAAYVFTKELGQAFRMSRDLEFGMVAINDGMLSTAEAPFGGIKESGMGREGSMHGVEEYTDIKYTLMSGLEN